MAQLANVTNYNQAKNYLDGKLRRKLGHNTYLIDQNDHISARYHSTDVVQYWPDGKIKLFTGGMAYQHNQTTPDQTDSRPYHRLSRKLRMIFVEQAFR